MKQRFEKEVSLARYTAFQIGGPAELFFLAKSRNDLIEALSNAQDNSISVTIIGGGSNLLISDDGVKGLVILNRANNYKFSGTKLFCESGAILSKVARESVENGLSGLDFATGIPGTIGGAVVGNAGAYGKETANVLVEAEVWDGEIWTLENKDLN